MADGIPGAKLVILRLRPSAADGTAGGDRRRAGRMAADTSCFARRERPRSGSSDTASRTARGHHDAARRHQQCRQGRDRAKDERKLSTLRMVNSTIGTPTSRRAGEGKPPLSDADLLGVFQKMIKQRQESVELYDKGGRAELAAQEREEIAIITAYLPKQMSEADVKAAIAAAIAETSAAGMKDMGKVVAALKAKYPGQMDFGKASGLVKAALTPGRPGVVPAKRGPIAVGRRVRIFERNLGL